MRIGAAVFADHMSKAAKTIIGFAVYMTLTGLVLIISPNTLFAILGLPLTDEPWIRLLGMFMIVVSYYYCRTAQSEAQEFFRATVHGRAAMGLFLVYLACTGAGGVLILFACGEWLGAALTWFALRSSPVPGR
jgi:hypothetical protein